MARSMDIEVSVALNFVISYLYSKLPRRRVDMFGEELEKAVRKKFEGHWYPEKPFKGSAFRCIKVSGEKVDPVMETAAAMSGLDIDEVKDNLPLDLSVWIDPNEVSYRIGEKGVVKLLYSNKNNVTSSGASHISDEGSLDGLDSEVQSANKGFNPDAQCFRPIDSLSSSLSNLSMSPSPTGNLYNPQPNGGIQAPAPAPVTRTSYLNRSSQSNTGFTAATFAQTKFGSTKLKTQAKRPTRLSPTEFGAYMRQKGTMQMPLTGVPNYGPAIASLLPSPGSARAPPHARTNSLSPRDPRLDLLEYQQRLMYMQHQQQQQQLPSPGGLPSSPQQNGGSLGDLYGSFTQQQQQQQQPASSLLSGLGGSHSDLLANPICSSLNTTLQQLQQQQLQQQLQQQQQQLQQHQQLPQQQAQQQEYLQQQLSSPPQPQQQQPDQQQQQQNFGLGLSTISANPSNSTNSSRAPFLQNTPSPEENKAFLDGFNLNSLPPYQNLQHLLVAN